MHIKTTISLLVFIFSLSVHAENIETNFCENKNINNPSYYIFNSSLTMKNKFPHLYHLVSDNYDSYFKQACAENKSIAIMTKEAESMCVQTCDTNADNYTGSKTFGKKEMGREIFNECASLCSTVAHGHQAYALGFKNGNKKSNDCVNPTKDSISELSMTTQKHIDNSQPTSAKGTADHTK